MTQEQKWLAYVAKIRNEHEEEITRLKSEYKEVIKELLPLAERMGAILGTRAKEHYKTTIDRAKALLQGSNQGQPLQE